MNTNQYWNPISLTTSISKTPSYESLSDEDKLQRRVKKIEGIVEQCNNILNIMINNEHKFNNRMKELSYNSPNFMKEFYGESPYYQLDNMFDAMIWLSYSDKEKKNILDNGLNDYE
jgi:hypothetical protein